MPLLSPHALAACTLSGIPAAALAHSGAAGEAHHGVVAGVLHPLFGLDHLLVMVTIGVWAVQLGGRARWLVPLTFIACMSLGALLPTSGVGAFMIESAILASLMVIGLLVILAWRLPAAIGAVLAGGFAVWHGAAHAAGAPAATSFASYMVGMLLATAALHAIGMMAVLLPYRARLPGARLAGGTLVITALILTGIWLRG